MRRDDLNGGVAAFFDLDGTLIAEPSLERRFFAHLHRRNAISIRNDFLWLARAVRLAPRGIQMMRHANKTYLRGVPTDERGYGGEAGQLPRRDSGQAEMNVPRFLPAAMNQVVWHARQGHGIVLVSGTLAPLADEMALALVVRLAVRGVEASVKGMLGGFTRVSRVDIPASKRLLAQYFPLRSDDNTSNDTTRALDCGAGESLSLLSSSGLWCK